MAKNILITWHFFYHGVAFLKHILSVLNMKYKNNEVLEGKHRGVSQYEMEKYFGIAENINKGFRFDKIYLLTVDQEVYDKNTQWRNRDYFRILEKLENGNPIRPIIESLEAEDIRSLDAQLSYLEKNNMDINVFQENVWQNIQHYTIKDQEKWIREISNFDKAYKQSQLEYHNFGKKEIDDLRFNEKDKAQLLKKWFDAKKKEFRDANIYIINSLGNIELSTVWHVLAEADVLPHNSKFIRVYDDKSNGDKYLKNFDFEIENAKIFSDFRKSIAPYKNAKSPKRELVNKLFKQYVKSGFAILIMGERGIGKSHLVKSHTKFDDNLYVECNCASFADDTMFESEFFGYEAGAFTGASKTKIGLLEKANEKILFMDEIHHLSKRVQSKLMTAFSTTSGNKMKYRRLGGNVDLYVKNVKLIFASNKSIEELRQQLLPDFYDRIVQQVIELPPLRETRQDIKEDFKIVWENLKFIDHPEVPDDQELYAWLKEIPLYGNFRDLQKIAMNYKNYIDFDPDTQKALAKNVLEYVKKWYNKLCNTDSADSKFFKIGKTAKEMEAEFHYSLRKWAQDTYGTIEMTAKKLGVSDKTLQNWGKRRYKTTPK